MEQIIRDMLRERSYGYQLHIAHVYARAARMRSVWSAVAQSLRAARVALDAIEADASDTLDKTDNQCELAIAALRDVSRIRAELACVERQYWL